MKRKFMTMLAVTLSASMIMSNVVYGAAISESDAEQSTISNNELDSESDTIEDGDFTYQVLEDGTLGISYTGSAEEVIIPDSYNGKTVTQINMMGLQNCSKMVTVSIPDSIKEIGWAAFAGCSSLKEITIPSGVTALNSSIYNCESLEKVILPDSLISIGATEFDNCKSLKEIQLPNSITSIGRQAFNGSGLTSIVLPTGMTYLEYGVFSYCADLKTVTIPKNIDEISEKVFEGCDNLTDIYYSGTKADWSNVSVAANNDWLNSVTIHCTDGDVEPEEEIRGDITEGDYTYQILSDGTAAITRYNGTATNLTVADTLGGKKVTRIAGYAFQDNKTLVNVEIPYGVKKIDEYAFDSSSVVSVTFPDTVDTLDNGVFFQCSSLKNVTLPSFIKKIPAGLFKNCINLTSVSFSNYVTEIESEAFANCDNLADVYYSGSREEWNHILIKDLNEAIKNAVIHYAIDDKPTEEPTEDPDAIPDGPTTWVGQNGTEGFVNRLYNVALCRESEEDGFNDWNNRLETKTETAAEVAQGFIFSDEFKNKDYNNRQFVKILYRTMFGREADEGGLDGWVDDLENGMSREYVYRGFAESQEFTNLCENYDVVRGSVTLSAYRDQNKGATGFIARLYTKMLGRDFDEAGIEDWCGKYLRGEYTIENIATDGFLHSQELQNQNLSNEEFVKRMYQTFLNREPDQAGMKDWVHRLEKGEVTRDTLVYGFTNSKEFANIKAEYGL